MQSRAAQTERLVRRAVRRARHVDAVRMGGAGLTVGAGVGLALVGVDRVWPLWMSAWVLIAVPPAVGLALAVLVAGLRRRTLIDAASKLDRALGLHDSLGNGLALANIDDPFAQIAVRDAERVASGVNLRRAAPVRWSNTWLAWPALCSAAVLVWIYVPHATWGQSPAVSTGGDAAEAADQIRALVDQTRDELADARIDGPASADVLETMDRLEEELRGGERPADDARIAAARSFDQLADEIERSAERDERVDGAVRDRFSGLESDAAGELADRLRDGDFEAAREAARESLRGAPEMTDAQRERLRREFTELADAIDQLDRQQWGEEIDADEPAPQPPRIDELAEQLERDGLDPDTARRVAERSEREHGQSEARREAQREMDRLRDALREAADRLDEPTTERPSEPDQTHSGPPEDRPPAEQRETSPPDDPPSRAPDDQTGESDQEEQQTDQSQPREEAQPGADQDRDRNEQQPGHDEPGDQPGQQQSPSPAQEDGDEPVQRPGGEQIPREQPVPAQGEEQTPEQRPDTQQLPQGDPEPRATPQPGGDDGRPSEPQPVVSPGEEDATDPGEDESQRPTGEQQPVGTDGEGASPESGRGLDEALGRLAERGEQIDRQQEQSRRMRERAQELLDNATPEQLEQLERWGAAMRQQHTTPTTPNPSQLDNRATTPADLRPRNLTPEEQERERVIAEWFGEQSPGDGDPMSGKVGERVREAADSALRAVEDQTVPVRRRELIKRVFDRVNERSERPPAPEGEKR